MESPTSKSIQTVSAGKKLLKHLPFGLELLQHDPNQPGVYLQFAPDNKL